MTDPTFQSDRRRVLQAGVAALAASALPVAHASDEKILIGYWPIASGLPLYAALERGFFKEAGLNVEGVKFASAQQVAEAMIAGRIHGSANGTASAVLGLAEITSPGLFKIICSNPSNHKLVLDQFVVPKDSPIKSIAELKGKRVGSGPGIQNVTLAKIILEKNGIIDHQGGGVAHWPARAGPGRRPARCGLHPGAHRHHRPAQGPDPRAGERRHQQVCAGRP